MTGIKIGQSYMNKEEMKKKMRLLMERIINSSGEDQERALEERDELRKRQPWLSAHVEMEVMIYG